MQEKEYIYIVIDRLHDGSGYNSTNHPFHCTNYFVHKFQSLKKELYKKSDLQNSGV